VGIRREHRIWRIVLDIEPVVRNRPSLSVSEGKDKYAEINTLTMSYVAAIISHERMSAIMNETGDYPPCS
jgi:hypothetical protein